jgi:hypothetical protein
MLFAIFHASFVVFIVTFWVMSCRCLPAILRNLFPPSSENKYPVDCSIFLRNKAVLQCNCKTCSLQCFHTLLVLIMVFWIMAQYSILSGYQRLGGACCLRIQGTNTIYGAVYSSELLVTTYKITQCHNPKVQDQNLIGPNVRLLQMRIYQCWYAPDAAKPFALHTGE